MTVGSFEVDGGLLQSTGCANTTPKMPRECSENIRDKWPREMGEMNYYASTKENQDDNVENWHRKFSDTDVNDNGEDSSTAHFTVRVVLFLAHFITPSHWLKFDLHAIHGCLSLIQLTPLFTSQPSSCPSSFSPSSTSVTSSSRSSTRIS